MFHFNVLFFKRIKIRKLETALIENVMFAILLQFIDHLWRFKGQFQSKFANLITIVSSTCLHYRCAASSVLTLTVPGVTRVTIGIGQKRVRSCNDQVLLVFEQSRLLIGCRMFDLRHVMETAVGRNNQTRRASLCMGPIAFDEPQKNEMYFLNIYTRQQFPY